MHHSVNMRSYGNYLIFTICASGMLLSICSGYELDAFYNSLLKLHNNARADHGSNPLILDPDMSSYAVECIEHYDLAVGYNWIFCNNLCFLFYNSKDIVNETAENVFLSWYNQGKDYDYSKEPENYNTAHFTQIVWQSTKRLGLTLMENVDGTLIVATYYPAGNQRGMYTDNVKEPNKKKF